MHISFIPYGKRDLVERLLRDMEAQKTRLPMTKDGQTKYLWIQAQVRQLPFGIYEYICAREDRDIVLATFSVETRHHNDYIPPEVSYLGMKINVMKILRMMTHSQPPPKDYDKKQKFLWIMENVDITLIGIKEDTDIVGSAELDNGWTHEAI